MIQDHHGDSTTSRERSRWKSISPLIGEAFGVMWARRRRMALAFPLIILNRLASLVIPGTTKFLIDDVITGRNFDLLPLLALIAGGSAVIEAASGLALVYLLGMEAQKSIAEYRRRIQCHLQRLPVSFFDATKTGTLLSRTMWDAEGLRHLVGMGLIQLSAGMVAAGGALVILFWLIPVLALTVVGLIVVFLTAMAISMRALRPLYLARSELYAQVLGRLSETYSGIRIVKAFRAERREARTFAIGVHKILRNALATMRWTAGLSSVSSLLIGGVAVAILMIGGRLAISGRISAGDLVSFTLYVGVMVAPMLMMIGVGSQLVEALAGLERIREVLDEPREDAGEGTLERLRSVEGLVQATDVDFEYAPGSQVLRGVTFEASPGTTTALVGPSGAGKSTLVSLVAGFYRPQSGVLTIDGRDVKTIRLDDYRKQIGIVPQDSFLFDGSVVDNIALGNPTASRTTLLEAARHAHVDEFVDRLPEGYDTIIGERGVRLSGGQQQRVAIARAIAADPKILILDEATSSLDVVSEALIRDAIDHLVAGRTTIVIAHRLSTVRRADQILVMENGEIIERGTHDTLIESGGHYRRLCDRQAELETYAFFDHGDASGQERERSRDDEDERPAPDTRLSALFQPESR